MEMFKNMEVVLMLSFGLVVAVALLARPSPHEEAVSAQDGGAAQIPVVVVTGKRLPPSEKARSSQPAG